MKKLSGLLAVSLVAIMMAPAARADIASTEYVNKNMEAKANKVTDTNNYTGDADSPDKYPSMAVANQMAKKAAAQNAAGKLDKVFAKNQNQVMVTDASGAVKATAVDTAGTGNAVTSVTVADGKYTVTKGTTFATKAELKTVQTTADNTASAVNNATTGLAATKAIADKNKTDIASMDTAYKAADTAINDKIGTVSAANMGTTATTVVGAIKEIKSAVSATDGATVKTDQGTMNKDKAVITNSTGKVTTGQIANSMIATGAVNADKIAASAVTSAKIADGTIVNADISDSAAIAQSKISGLTDALAAKFVAPGTSATSTDGTYTLTMKVVNNQPTYAWEKIGRE